MQISALFLRELPVFLKCIFPTATLIGNLPSLDMQYNSLSMIKYIAILMAMHGILCMETKLYKP